VATNLIVLDGEAPSISESSPTPQNDPGPSDEQRAELQRAERYGAMEAEYRQAQERIAQLEARIVQLEAERQDVAALRSELAQLRSEVFEMEDQMEETQEESETDVTLVTPEPEPESNEEPPETPKESLISRLCRM
jgi:predicted  nucleic acid-binding Zn-ribbon protein